MHTVHIYIEEGLDLEAQRSLESDLMREHWISNVALHEHTPHDVVVEYEQHHMDPRAILGILASRGLHSDVTAC